MLLALLVATACAFDRITGAMSALFTPMNDDMTVAYDQVESVAQLMHRKSIKNVMVAGTTGESVSLTTSERKQLLEEWMKHKETYDLNVYAHVGGDSVFDARDLAEHAASVGATGVLAMSPNYFMPANAADLVDTMAYVAAGAPKLPFWYYHFPDMTGVKIRMFDFLTEANSTNKIPNLMGVKFTDEQLMDFMECVNFAGGKYNMIYGRDEQLLSALVIGAEASVGSTFNFLDYNLDLLKAYENGDMKTALAMQKKTTDVCNIFGNYPGTNIQKQILKMTGLKIGPPRFPQMPLSDSQYKEVQQILRDMGVLPK